jgi:hypothetical protein
MSSYEIRVRGRLDAHWAAWFEGLTLAYEGDTTVLRGSLVDEAALHGVLSKISGLNLHLLSVNAVETGDAVADPPAGISHDYTPMEATPNGSAGKTPPSKRKARPARKVRRKRPPP